MGEEKVAKPQTVAEMELEIKKLELEAKQLEVKERKANVQDLEERLAERELKRVDKQQKSKINGASLKSIASDTLAAQTRCNHRKGGNGAQGVVAGQGDDAQYSVLKHAFSNGDVWVRCLRCGKTWKPPIENRHTKEKYIQLFSEYQAALNFQTRNSTSGSVAFKFSDGGAFYREQMEHTTLR